MFETGAEDGTDDPVVLPVSTWLIRRPKGAQMFDCGMHADLCGPGELLDVAAAERSRYRTTGSKR